MTVESHLIRSRFRHAIFTYCKKLKKYGFGVASNGVTPITNVITIRPAILKQKDVDRWTDGPIGIRFIHIVQRTENK